MVTANRLRGWHTWPIDPFTFSARMWCRGVGPSTPHAGAKRKPENPLPADVVHQPERLGGRGAGSGRLQEATLMQVGILQEDVLPRCQVEIGDQRELLANRA